MSKMTKVTVVRVTRAHVTEHFQNVANTLPALVHGPLYVRDEETEAFSQSLLSVVCRVCLAETP